jgi:signal transduction histidine kinase
MFHFTIRPAWWQTTLARAGLLAMVLAISSVVMRFINQRKLERQKAVLEKQRAIQEERARISSDLHDDLGSGLSSIRFMAEKIKRTQQTVPGADIDRIQSTSDELTDKMNEIIWAMSEKHDTLEDLLSYTRGYAARYCDEHDLLHHISLPEQVPHLFVSGRVRRNVFLCVKEALHNVVKHADAQHVYLQLVFDGDLHVTIRDDGIGMPAGTATSSGHGLRNLERRIGELKGKLSIEGSNGVTVKFTVPVESQGLSGV